MGITLIYYDLALDMSQISRRWVKPEVQAKIDRLLSECIVRCADATSAVNLIDTLLTSTEKVMLGKRIAIALMLIKGDSVEQIIDILKVSRGTVYTVRVWLAEKGKQYRALLADIAKRDKAQLKEHDFYKWEATETKPGYFQDWKAVKRSQWEKVKKTKVPF